MFERIFPKQVDNIYSGSNLALYFFFLITLITIGRSCVHIFSADGGAQSIATIPLDSFTQGGAETVVYIFAQWGIAQLMVGLIYLLVALRYRSLIPLMYGFIFLEWGSRMGLTFLKNIETAGTAPAAIGQLVLVILIPLMFYLSLRQSPRRTPSD
ncbi:MAG: hypothetical protein P8N94_16340 [Gammaproteobacteria bacterium]|nr:hypothetical protein [Gammaproteobacteria bacterium]MDG2339531.1 hypothetical protein [Gammaproteobacteria bacterium]